jgi:DNA-binding PadR family transcriptional regulator
MGPGGPPSFAFAKAFATAGGRGPRGGRARRGDVRTAVLVLLDEQPQHGYQLITEFERRTDGRWKPSPGSVYPVLSQLTDEGLVRPEEVDGRKVFHLTDEGRAAAADARERHGERLWGDDEGAEWPPQPLMEAFVGLAGAAWQVAQAGDPNQIEHARAVIDDTRRVLYRILADEAPEA